MLDSGAFAWDSSSQKQSEARGFSSHEIIYFLRRTMAYDGMSRKMLGKRP